MRTRLLLTAVLLLLGCDSSTPEEHLQRALEHIQAGEFNPSVIELKNTLQKAPENAEARYRLGVQYELGGDYASAEKELQRALDLGYERKKILPPLLRSKVQLGKHEEVLTALSEDKNPTAELIAIEGLARLAAGDIDAAVERFDTALAAEPDNVDAHLGLATVGAYDEPQEALRHLERALEADPARREAWVGKGKIELRAGEFETAHESFSHAAKLPGGEIVGGLGVVESLIRANRLEPAEAEVRELLRVFSAQGMARYFLGLIEYQNGNLEDAIAELRQAQRSMPDYPPAMLLLGTALYRSGEVNQASDQLQHYLASAPAGLPQNADARKILASIQLQSNRPDEAVANLTRETDLLDAQGLAMLGAAYQRQGNHSAAAIFLQRAVEMAPDQAQLRTQLAMSLAEEGQDSAALTQLESADKLGEADPVNDELTIRLLLKQQEFDKARTAAEAMIASHAKTPSGYHLLGVALQGLGQQDAAVAAYRRALDRDPSYEPAIGALKQVAQESGKPDESLKYYQELNENAPGNEAAAMALVRQALQEDDTRRAIDILERARSSNPNALDVRIVLARLRLGLGDVTGATPVIEEAAKLSADVVDVRLLQAQLDTATRQPKRALQRLRRVFEQEEPGRLPREAHVLLAQLEGDAGEYGRAADVLTRWVDKNQEDLSSRLLQATYEMQAGRFDEARGHYEDLVDELPRNVMVLNNLASLYARQSDERAVDYARRAYAIEPDRAEVADTYGWILFERKEYEQSVDVLRQAYAAMSHPSIGYHLAMALNALGDSAEALRVAEQALQSDAFPERKDLEALVSRINESRS